MIHALMNINDAMDIVDAWGPDPDLWPRADRDVLEEMLKTDEDFADYVADVKRIDDMLSNWEEGLDGAEINWDDLDRGNDESDKDEDDKDPNRFDDEDQDVDLGAPPPIDHDDDADDEQEFEDGGPIGGGDGAGSLQQKPQDEDDDTVVEIDPDQMHDDMDGMFQDFIRKLTESDDDSEFRVFTRDYDSIVDLPVPDDTPLDRIDQAVALSTGALQKELRRLIAAQSQAKRIPGKRSGRLHAPNLHRILSGDDRVFTRREEAPTLDTAISLVIDNSGSMMGERLKLAAETAYAIGSVLHRLGVTFECLGFTDATQDPRCQTPGYLKEVAEAHAIAPITRSTPIIMPKFKLFEERWLQPVQRRFAYVFNHGGGYGPNGQGVVPFGSTPEGCGVEFAARRLLARKEKRKIMIVMTDGEPGGQVYNYQYGGTRPYVKQAADMVKSVSAAGIDLIGIGIQHAGPKRYYPDSMVIKDLSEMPSQLMALLKRFMLGK